MAKSLNQYNAEIVNGSKVESSHIKQFADAFTATEEYDIAISGSLTVNGIEIKNGQLSSGTNYITVLGTGTPTENAAELQAAYDAAKTMPRYLGDVFIGPDLTLYKGQTFRVVNDGNKYMVAARDFTGALYSLQEKFEISEAEAKSTRTTVIVAPGEYNFGATAFRVNSSGINIVSLTGNPDVIVRSSEILGITIGIFVSADYALLKGIDCKTNTFYITNSLDNLICEHCIGGNYSFGGDGTASGTFNHCIGGFASFGGYGTASGTFNNCTGGGGAFGSYGDASGMFNDCTSGGYSFGCESIASGTFNYCTGGDGAFGGYDGIASGVFNNCTGGHGSFGYGGTVSGVFNNCTGGGGSFGTFGTITAPARLYYTRLTSGTFPTPVTGGRLILCIDGNNNIKTI